MGQGPNVSTAKRIRRSGVQAQEPNEAGAAGIEPVPDSNAEILTEMLVAPLYLIEGSTLRATEVGDAVAVRENGEEQEVWVNRRRLGNIGPLYRRKIRAGGFWGGVVHELREDPLSATVRLYRQIRP